MGLIRADGSEKPVLLELKNFDRFIQSLPFKELPAVKPAAVVVLTEGQDAWAGAYSSFILAEQAGFNVSFQYINQPLKPVALYLLPSVKGINSPKKYEWENLLEKVRAGADLYVSTDNGYFSPFNKPFGLEVAGNAVRTGNASFNSQTMSGNLKFAMPAPLRLDLKPTTAKVIAAEDDGNPVFTVNNYGSGKIYLLTFPLENNMSKTPGSFNKNQPEIFKIYQHIAAEVLANRVAKDNDSFVLTTEHDLNQRQKIVVMVNYDDKISVAPIEL